MIKHDKINDQCNDNQHDKRMEKNILNIPMCSWLDSSQY